MAVNGEKLVFRTGRELYLTNLLIDSHAEIYTPGNGQKVGEYFKVGNDFVVLQYQNSGDLRQLLNNNYRSIYYFKQELSNWKCREFEIEAQDFDVLMDICSNHNLYVELNKIKYSRGVVHFECYFRDTLICTVTIDLIQNKAVEIRSCNVAPELINDVYKFFGNCKYTGNVHTIVFLNGNRVIFDNKAEMLDMTRKVYFYECIKGKDRGKLFNDINSVSKGLTLKKYILHRDYNRYYVEPTSSVIEIHD